ncbi:hypothetical protein GHT06_016347 [Daphnia sinensis]|uniref:MAM domain-containing protein n=1 Tax=Daphnia sinensis TaxID=1820382 RepID=A0AAD5KNH5_9CRUS|nr:hypothetical protein GHT06_016347 [Daphnia sinensis]
MDQHVILFLLGLLWVLISHVPVLSAESTTDIDLNDAKSDTTLFWDTTPSWDTTVIWTPTSIPTTSTLTTSTTRSTPTFIPTTPTLPSSTTRSTTITLRTTTTSSNAAAVLNFLDFDIDFENGTIGSWTEASRRSAKWKVENKNSPWESDNPAPPPSTGSSYLRVDRGGSLSFGVAILRSPVIMVTPDMRNFTLSFSYWIRSKWPQFTNLEVYIAKNGKEEYFDSFYKDADINNRNWTTYPDALITIGGNFKMQVVFYAYCGTNVEDAVAIDDISLTYTSDATTTTVESTTSSPITLSTTSSPTTLPTTVSGNTTTTTTESATTESITAESTSNSTTDEWITDSNTTNEFTTSSPITLSTTSSPTTLPTTVSGNTTTTTTESATTESITAESTSNSTTDEWITDSNTTNEFTTDDYTDEFTTESNSTTDTTLYDITTDTTIATSVDSTTAEPTTVIKSVNEPITNGNSDEPTTHKYTSTTSDKYSSTSSVIQRARVLQRIPRQYPPPA